MATQTLTFWCTSIEGGPTMVWRLGDGRAGALAGYHWPVRAGSAAHGSGEAPTRGDGVVSVFATPVACAATMFRPQRALVSHGWPAGEPMRTRRTIDGGEASQTVAGPGGLAVRPAARIAAVAHGS